MASSTYAGIEGSFGISNEVAILTVSLFVMGLGIGPLLVGPVSEFIGRRAVYLWSYIAFLRESSASELSFLHYSILFWTVFTFPVAFSNNARKPPSWNLGEPPNSPSCAAVHMIFRFLCGFAGASFLSVGAGSIADLFENDKVGT